MNKPTIAEKKQVKLQFTVTEGYEILLDRTEVETFKQRLADNELSLLDTKDAKQISYEFWSNEY